MEAIVFSAFFVLIGNVFPIFLNFKGGKGIGVSVGIFFSLLPMESMAGFVVFILAVLITRMISVGSLLSVTTMLVFTFIKLGFGWFFGLALLAGLLVWWTHRQNIKRILSGTENKIGKKAG
jgi:glycerol-3-phosphate acyltransferase PlsY